MAESQTCYVSHAPAMEILQQRGTVYYNLQLEAKGIDNKPGLSLRGGGRGFPPATKNVAPAYFHRKIEEK